MTKSRVRDNKKLLAGYGFMVFVDGRYFECQSVEMNADGMLFEDIHSFDVPTLAARLCEAREVEIAIPTIEFRRWLSSLNAVREAQAARAKDPHAEAALNYAGIPSEAPEPPEHIGLLFTYDVSKAERIDLPFSVSRYEELCNDRLVLGGVRISKSRRVMTMDDVEKFLAPMRAAVTAG